MPENLSINQRNPQESEAKSEVLDFNSPSYSFVPRGNHVWRQQGPYLVCKSCELQHAVWIGVDRFLTGINEEGMPILKKKEEVF